MLCVELAFSFRPAGPEHDGTGLQWRAEAAPRCRNSGFPPCYDSGLLLEPADRSLRSGQEIEDLSLSLFGVQP